MEAKTDSAAKRLAFALPRTEAIGGGRLPRTEADEDEEDEDELVVGMGVLHLRRVPCKLLLLLLL